MQTLVLFAVLLTSYLTSAGLLAQPGFGSFRQAGRKSDVNEDIDAFINLIPRAKIEGIVNNWIAKDEEVQEDLVYVHSDNFQEHVRKLESSSEFQAVRKQLEGAHVNVARLGNMVHEILGMEPMKQSNQRNRSNIGLRGCLDEIYPTIPINKFILEAAYKLFWSSEFRGLVSVLRSHEFKQNTHILLYSKVATGLAVDAQSNGVDTWAIYDFFRRFTTIYNELIDAEI